MCGILAIINNTRVLTAKNLKDATSIISHRGPDDEGLLTWSPGDSPHVFAGKDTAGSTRSYWNYPDLSDDAHFKVGFGHRRLSILDLSATGHQPMIYEKANLSITFNGEIYNYLEVKSELETIGHTFKTSSDTEVILHAWEEWGVKCLDKFNGMFAFVILDHHKKELYAVRDRFGVKPVYYYQGESALYIVSEIKQIRTSPDYKFSLNEPIARQFLATGIVDHTDNTFDAQIRHLSRGHYLYMDLSDGAGGFQIKKWYTLVPKRWKGSFEDAVSAFRSLLIDAIDLRLRSDVKVGSCLSGGLDSSSIVCIAAELLKAKGDFVGQETVTACYDIEKYDEWKFAQEVIEKTGTHPHRVFPEFDQLKEELDKLLWHQDEPCSTTSIFSGWMVFKKTHEARLKVMLNGQGADEQLAGYGGSDLPLYTGLLGKLRLLSLYDEARNYKKEHGGWPYGFLIGALQLNLGQGFSNILPQKYKLKNAPDVDWLHKTESSSIYTTHTHSLQENLLRQVYGAPLPGILRFEDHNSMAWSVEARTPFMDYRLFEFDLGLPEDFVYKNGVRKTILRHAMHSIIPESIENRKDKMGFVTPEEVWLKGEGKEWFLDNIDKACQQFDGYLLNATRVHSYVSEMIEGKREFDSMPWRIVCFYKWFNLIANSSTANIE